METRTALVSVLCKTSFYLKYSIPKTMLTSDFVRTLNGFNFLFYNNNNEGSALPVLNFTCNSYYKS